MASCSADRRVMEQNAKLLARLYQRCNGSRSPPTRVKTLSTSVQSQLIPPLTLQVPDKLDHILGYSSDIVCSVQETFLDSAAEIQAAYQTLYQQACQELLRQVPESPKNRIHLLGLRASVERHYKARLSDVENLAIRRAEALATTRAGASTLTTTQKSLFNQEYTPLLERYFELNAYPSIGHRLCLAQKTMMTPRQITVWFQNHRNRAKKEGRPLIKNPGIRFGVIATKQNSDSEDGNLPDSEWSGSEDEDSYDEQASQPSVPDIVSSFSKTSPPHAFPTPYPPLQREHDPFPSKSEERRFSTPWYRKLAPPRSAKLKKVKEVEIDELCTEFMIKVHVRAPDKPQGKRRRRWDAHLCTIPHPAPLPSLISKPVESVPSRPLKKLPKRRAPASWQKAFDIPNNSLVSLVPPSPVSNELIKGTGRWITRLSRQTRPQPLSRASTPSTSSTLARSSPSSPAVDSRRRPLESDSSSSSLFSSPSPKRRRTSPSSSDISSSLSSAIATPQTSSTNLPTAIVTPTTSSQGPDFDFSSLDELFGDFPPAPPLTAAELFQFGFQPPTIPTNKDSFNISAFLSQPQPPVFATTS